MSNEGYNTLNDGANWIKSPRYDGRRRLLGYNRRTCGLEVVLWVKCGGGAEMGMGVVWMWYCGID